ncbi:MAG: DUF2304 domain-containing protein [Lachnospiraceae bacterium]|nr:DUF2304 domain-containing protein [Lachnospiraceae bacterium]MDD7701651.1 DUF2304 domain-containing protein [Lachnospiraceae bacterium]
MTLELQILVAILAIFACVYITRLLRTKRIELKYVLLWYLVLIMLLILDLVPGALNGLTALLDFQLPVNMMFFAGFIFVLLILFSHTVILSELSKRNERLTQMVGLLDQRVTELEKRLGETDKKSDERDV